MPANMVKTEHDEELWERAKAQAAKEGHAEDWPYVTGIFERMKHHTGGGKIEKALDALIAEREGPEALRKSLYTEAELRHRWIADAPMVRTQRVYDYLLQNYPASTLRWARSCSWRLSHAVPMSEIRMARRPGGRNPEKVAHIEDAIRAGQKMEPVVLVETPDGLEVADGYHRTLAYQHLGRKTITAYVAIGADEHGPWEREMHARKLNKAMRLVLKSAAAGEHWITIGGHEEGDKKHADGQAVKIDSDGRIVAGGPKFMHGKKISDTEAWRTKGHEQPPEPKKRTIHTVSHKDIGEAYMSGWKDADADARKHYKTMHHWDRAGGTADQRYAGVKPADESEREIDEKWRTKAELPKGWRYVGLSRRRDVTLHIDTTTGEDFLEDKGTLHQELSAHIKVPTSLGEMDLYFPTSNWYDRPDKRNESWHAIIGRHQLHDYGTLRSAQMSISRDVKALAYFMPDLVSDEQAAAYAKEKEKTAQKRAQKADDAKALSARLAPLGVRQVVFNKDTQTLKARKAVTEAATQAFECMGKVMDTAKIRPVALILGKLEGAGKRTLAYYTQHNHAITISDAKGYGPFFHEYGHAVDYGMGRPYLHAGPWADFMDYVQHHGAHPAYVANAKDKIQNLKAGHVGNLMAWSKDLAYVRQPDEVFARFFAEWVQYRLEQKGGVPEALRDTVRREDWRGHPQEWAESVRLFEKALDHSGLKKALLEAMDGMILALGLSKAVRWVTVGGHEEGEAKHKGGRRIQIDDDGTILAGGPKYMRGKKIGDKAAWAEGRKAAGPQGAHSMPTPKGGGHAHKVGDLLERDGKTYRVTSTEGGVTVVPASRFSEDKKPIHIGDGSGYNPVPKEQPKAEPEPEEAKEPKQAVAGPYTKKDQENAERFSWSSHPFEKMNEEHQKMMDAYREDAEKKLRAYGVEGVPEDVEEALTKLGEAYVHTKREEHRATGMAPGAYMVGPSNYHGKHDKADAIRKNAYEALDKAKDRLESAIKRHSPNKPVQAGEQGASGKIQAKLQEREKLQERMKAANAVVRKKISDEEKIKLLQGQGFSESQAQKLLQPDFLGRPGFPDFQLKNNLAEIKRLRDRLAQADKMANTAPGSYAFEGGTIEDNADENRVQIVFDGKPSLEMRDKLKARGFRWAPSQGAWQRQRTPQALAVAKEIVGVQQKALYLTLTKAAGTNLDLSGDEGDRWERSSPDAGKPIHQRPDGRAFERLDDAGEVALNTPSANSVWTALRKLGYDVKPENGEAYVRGTWIRARGNKATFEGINAGRLAAQVESWLGQMQTSEDWVDGNQAVSQVLAHGGHW